MLRLLDLYCGTGGAAKGYRRAGFYVVGVDVRPQARYEGNEFHQADALEFPLDGFDAIHASPPCQFASSLRAIWEDRGHLNLIPQTRERLLEAEVPYVIENVMGARPCLRSPFMLCGSMFGLGANGRQLRRHRFFETNFPVMVSTCQHRDQPVGVYGSGGGVSTTRGYKGTGEEYREAMDLAGHSKREIAQAIPPAYTEHIGHFLRQHLEFSSLPTDQLALL